MRASFLIFCCIFAKSLILSFLNIMAIYRPWREVPPRGAVLEFCSIFRILSYVISRKILRSPFAKQFTGLFCSLRSTPLILREFRRWRIFLRSAPDKRACRSSSAECEPLFAPLARGGSHFSTKKEKVRGCVPSLFWWSRGESNPCPKTS